MLQKVEKEIPAYNVPLNYMSGGADIAKAYALLGQKQKALDAINAAWKEACQYETYYLSLDGTKFAISQRDCMIQLSIMSQLSEITKMVDKNLAAKQKTQVDNYYRVYIGKGGQAGE